jgi:hypothetical protein
MAKDRIVIPGIPTDAARVIIDRIRQNEDRLALIERTSGRPGIVSSDTAAVVGEFLNIAGRSDELITIILPEPTQARRNARVTLAFRNEHNVRIVAVNGTVNGAAFVLNNLPGTYDAICDGLGGWAVQVGVTEEGVIGTPGVPGALAPIPDQRVLGNDSGVDAVPTPITVHQELDWIVQDALWQFDGVDDRVDYGDALDIERTDLVTVAAWVRTPSTAAAQAIISKISPGPTFQGYEFGIEAPGKLYFLLVATVVGGNLINAQTATGLIPVGALTHFAAVYSGTSLATGVAFYINGALVATSGVAGPGPITSTTVTAQNLSVGRSTSGASPFSGEIHHVARFAAALTAAQILEVYNSGTPPDLNALPTAPAPVWWVKLDASDAVGASGILDYGSGSNEGTAGGGFNPGTIVGSVIARSTAVWQSIPPGTDGDPFCSNGPGEIPSYQQLDQANTGALTGDVTKAAGSSVTAIAANVIVNADVNTAAAIAQTKLGATTGFSVKASGASATTSAEPIVTYSASANMSAERVTTSSASVTVSTSVANQIEFQRAALIGDVTAAANSNTTAIAAGVIVDADVSAVAAIAQTKTGALIGDVTKASGSDTTAIAAGVIVNADVNASAAIAISKLENVGANVAIGTTTSGTVPTAISVATDTAMARIGEGATNTGYGAQSRDDMNRWLASQTNVRVFEEEFQGRIEHHTGNDSRFAIVSGLAGVALSTLVNSTGEYTGALNLSSGAGNGTTRSTYTLGANESAFNFHWESLRYFGCVFRTRLATTANTHWALGLVGPFSGYGAVTADVLAGTSEGIFVTGVTSASANIHVGRRTSSATAKTDTGVAVADNRFQYEFFRTAAGVDYHYLNGSLIRTDASGIAPANTACTFFFSMIGSTTAERAVELDHIKVVMQSTNRFT